MPKGIENEAIITLVGKGRKKLNSASDLIIRVLLRPHPLFKRQGCNILSEKSISVS